MPPLVFALLSACDWTPDPTIEAEALDTAPYSAENGRDEPLPRDDTATEPIPRLAPLAFRGGVDRDGDGYAAGDCDDADAAIHPGATDAPDDGVDQDCDGVDTTTATDTDTDVDTDGDGFTVADGDCDDDDEDVYPGAIEVWYDGIDADCDGASDFDQDGDGHNVGLDCDDTNADLYPDALDFYNDGIDNDCDGDDGSPNDVDGDGHDDRDAGGDDCNDWDPAMHPGATDYYGDGLDSDCDGDDGDVFA